MRRYVLLSVVLLLMRVDAGASTRQDVDAIRAAKRVDAVPVTQADSARRPARRPGVAAREPATDFYQQQPAEFSPATRRTEVRFAYDDDTLYLGAMMFDDEPDELITNELRRDFNGSDGDGSA